MPDEAIKDELIVARLWKSFEAAAIREDAGPIQRSSMRTAFYSGAAALFQEILRMKGAGIGRALQDELTAFCDAEAQKALSVLPADGRPN